MRYENSSNTGSSNQTNPEARNDTDALAAGSHEPATGNLISGAGTQSGASGADVANGAHIVAITGAQGTDTSLAGGHLSVNGEFGRLSVDANGNYSYQAHANAPENSRDVFTYKLADASGRSDSATLTIEIGKTPAVVRADAHQMVVGPDGVVVLPAGVELSDVHVVGRNLVIDMPDGSQMLILDGAVFVPRLVLGDVEVPATNLAALLIDSEPKPAAGPPQSSGGNFALPVGPLDPGVPLGDLIPPTQLGYTPPDYREVGLIENNKPSILIETPDQPLGVENATASVNENALPARGLEPAGSNSASTAETTTGTIIYTSLDTPNTISVAGVTVTGVGQAIPLAFGVLTITSISNGAIGYSYTLADNTFGDNTQENVAVVIRDADGDTDTATLTISIIDDVPTARPDVDSVTEDGPLVADGNLLTAVGGTDVNSSDGVADTPGADGIQLTGISFGSTAGTVGAPLSGAYGSLVVGANGSYVYTLNNALPAVQALGATQSLTETFTYTITDGDGDVRSTTLTITINGTNDRPTIVAGAATVSEEGLSAGNPDAVGLPTDVSNSATISGQLSVADVDNNALTVTLGAPAGAFTSHGQPVSWSVSADGHVLTGTAGGATVATVTLANSGSYTVVLAAPLDHPNAGGEDVLSLVIPVAVNDGTVSVSSTLTVSVEDDSPVITSAPVVGAGVVIDETDGANPVSSGAPIVRTSSGAILTAGVGFGADGQGSVTYALTLNGGGGVGSSIASGLQTALGDLPITLTLTSATLVTATYNGGANTAFTIAMNANGTITVSQFTALEHLVDGSTAEAFDDALNLVANGVSLVGATAVYRDFDGDSATAAAGIGGAITFRDDGPSIELLVNLPTSGPALTAIQLTTSDNGTEGAGFTSASTGAAFGGTFDFRPDGGGDGTASAGINYALSLSVAPGTDSKLDSNGASIFLYLINGTVVGSTSTTAPATIDGPSVVFTIATSVAGAVTLTQYQQIDHPSEAPNSGFPFADQLATLGTGLVQLIATATITDNDGDFANSSQPLDLGNFIRFTDDGPDINATLVQGATIRIDETDGVAAAGGEVDPLGGNLGTVTMSAASLVTVSTVAPSADSPTTNSYSLSISAPGVASGLLLSTTNQPIVLINNNGTIEGHVANAAGAIAFTVSINPGTGDTTLTQFLAVEHFNTASNDEDSSGLTPGVLILNVTATDFDGDTDVASVDLGSIVRFEDDGPTPALSGAALGTVVLDETRPVLTDTPGGSAPGGTASATINLAAGFVTGGAIHYGSDGAGSVGYSFALSGPSVGSGLFALDASDTLGSGVGGDGDGIGQGVEIQLTLLNNVVTGAVGGTTYFTITLDPVSGVATFAQLNPIWQPVAGGTAAAYDDAAVLSTAVAANFQVVQTLIDSDGDRATASLAIGQGVFQIQDDGPDAINDGTLATLDDNAVGVTIGTVAGITGNDHFGADGPGGAVTIGAGSLGGSVSIVGGNLVYTAGAGGNVTPGGPNLTETFTYTIKDGDGDTDTATFSVTLTDGGPSIAPVAASIAVDEEGLGGGNAGTVYLDGSDLAGQAVVQTGTLAGFNYGVDGPGDVVLAAVADTGLRSLAGAVVASSWNAATHTLTGYVDNNASGTFNAGDTAVFTLQITDPSNGAYRFELLQPVRHAVANSEDDASFSVGVTITDHEGDPATGAINILIDDDSPDAINDGLLATLDDNVAGVVIGTVAGITGNDHYGADGAAASGAITIATGSLGGTVTIDGTGQLVYTSHHNTAPGGSDAETFTYTIKDGDGDTDTATFSVTLTDGGPSIAPVAASIAVDEEGLGGRQCRDGLSRRQRPCRAGGGPDGDAGGVQLWRRRSGRRGAGGGGRHRAAQPGGRGGGEFVECGDAYADGLCRQ